jgi:hypothetical protein
MRRALLLATALAFFAAFGVAAETCDASAASCPASPSNCSEMVTRSLEHARIFHGDVATGTSPQQPAIVVPLAQLPYIPNVRFRMTLTRQGGGGVLQWWLQWVHPYALEVSNRTIATGHFVIEGVYVDWPGLGCSAADGDVMRGLVVGAMAGLCVRMQGVEEGEAHRDQEESIEPQTCFQEFGIADMLQLQSPTLAQKESYEFFMFFHWAVKPFCRPSPTETCWGSDDDLGAFGLIQPHKLYKFTLFLDISTSACRPSSPCRTLSQSSLDVDFYAVFHSAPGDCIQHC